MSASTAQPIVLSQKLVDDGARRLTTFAVILAIAIVMWHVVLRLAQPQMAAVIDDPVNRLSALVVVLMAIALVALQRYAVVTSRTLLGLGLVFEVAVAFSIAMVETSSSFDATIRVLGISAVGPLIALPVHSFLLGRTSD
jgi:predicted membrane protein